MTHFPCWLRRCAFALLACTAVSGAISAQAAESPDAYAHLLPLQVSGTGPWYRLRLSVETQLLAQHADLRDLRIFNAEGQALPYSLTVGMEQRHRTAQQTPVRLFPLYGPATDPAAASTQGELRVVRNAEGTIVEIPASAAPSQEKLRHAWLLDASAIDDPLEKLTLDWQGGADGFQHLRIEASDDLSRWRDWGEGQIAQLNFQNERIDRRQIDLPGERARYLRLSWLSPREAPELRSATLSSTRASSTPAALADWTLPAARIEKDGIVWDLPQALPLERLRIVLEQPNSLAPVRLYSRRAATEPWNPLASSLLYRLPADGREMRQETIDLPGYPVRQLRLQIDERGTGLDPGRIVAQASLRTSEVSFLARGTAPYRLALGKADASAANLPLETLIPSQNARNTLGQAQLASPPPASARTVPPVATPGAAAALPWKRIALWGVLLLGVLLLGLMASSLLRLPNRASGE